MSATCSTEGCERQRHSRGMCSSCYMRWRRYGSPTEGRPIGRPKGTPRVRAEKRRTPTRDGEKQLSAEPLVRAIERYLRRHDISRTDFAADVGVADKTLRRWGCCHIDRFGRAHYPERVEVPCIDWIDADVVITYMDMLWWDVYDADEYPEAHARAAVLLGGEREAVAV